MGKRVLHLPLSSSLTTLIKVILHLWQYQRKVISIASLWKNQIWCYPLFEGCLQLIHPGSQALYFSSKYIFTHGLSRKNIQTKSFSKPVIEDILRTFAKSTVRWKTFQDFLKDYKISKVSSHIYLYYVSKLFITEIFQWIPFTCMFVPSSCLSVDHEVDKPIFELMKKGSYRSKMCTKRSFFLSY